MLCQVLEIIAIVLPGFPTARKRCTVRVHQLPMQIRETGRFSSDICLLQVMEEYLAIGSLALCSDERSLFQLPDQGPGIPLFQSPTRHPEEDQSRFRNRRFFEEHC